MCILKHFEPTPAVQKYIFTRLRVINRYYGSLQNDLWKIIFEIHFICYSAMDIY